MSAHGMDQRSPVCAGYPVVLFDGVCNWCGFWVQFLIRRDRHRRFRFLPLQSEPGQRLLAAFRLPVDRLDTMVVIDGDACYTKSSAVLHVAKRMGGCWPVLTVLPVIPPRVRDFLYDLMATHRYRLLGRRRTCMVRPADAQDLLLQ